MSGPWLPLFIILWSVFILFYGLWLGYRVGRNDGRIESLLDDD